MAMLGEDTKQRIDSSCYFVGNNDMKCRRTSRTIIRLYSGLLLLCIGLSCLSLAETTSISLSPDTIKMGAFYNGSVVRIQGSAPPGSGIIVVIRGDKKDEFFNRKGRVGPIWINTDKVHVAAVPSLFLSFASSDISSLLDRRSIDTYELDDSSIASHLVCRIRCKCSGQHAAKASVESCKGVSPDSAYQALIRKNFIALKSSNGSYRSYPKAVQLASTGGESRYDLTFDWLRNAPPGSYRVEVYACRDRAVIARADSLLSVVEVGFPVQMAALAKDHPFGYGILAVLAAVLAGFTIDTISSRLRSKGRARSKPAEAAVPEPEFAAQVHPGSAEVHDEDPVHHL
jgi:Putative transmembrane protein (Alph_Pro_TM)